MSVLIDCRSIRFFHVEKGRNAGFVLVFGAIPARILKHRGWNNLIYIKHVSLQFEFLFF